MTTFIVNSNSQSNSAGNYVVDSNSCNGNSNSRTYSADSNSFNNKQIEGVGQNKSIVNGEAESQFPPYGFNEIENIDTMELEYVYEIETALKKVIFLLNKIE